MEILRVEQENGTLHGVIVQFGGQTPLKLANDLEAEGIPIVGTTPDAIDLAEDRERFQALVNQFNLKQPKNGIASTDAEALAIAEEIGFPLVIRPSYVLGGRAMEIVRDMAQLERYIAEAVVVSGDSPVLLDSYLAGAVELDVDALCDGKEVHVTGIMQHIEEAGVHSGDSACSLPPYSLSKDVIKRIEEQTHALALALNVVGLMNVQFAIKDDEIYLIEVNPRASRTAPFVSKAIGQPLAKLAARVMLGEKLVDLGFSEPIVPEYFSVKAPVFPFNKFIGVDTVLGPEMKSTGEVMGIDANFGAAFAKAQLAAGNDMPRKGKVFVSVRDEDKRLITNLVVRLHSLGYELCATSGTLRVMENAGVTGKRVFKVHEGRPNVIDLIKNREVNLIINTPSGRMERHDDKSIRSTAVQFKVPCITTLAAAAATIQGLEWISRKDLRVKTLQEFHAPNG